MKTVTVNVDIPEGYELADSVIRQAIPGERYVDDTGVVQSHISTKPSIGKYVIVRKITPVDMSWWPEWLTCEWVAKDCVESESLWCGFTTKPIRREKWWDVAAGSTGECFDIPCKILGIQFPDVPWEVSLFHNPHKTKG